MDKQGKIFIAGHRGLLGSAVCRNLSEKGYDSQIKKSRQELDLLNQQQTLNFFEEERPDYVFLCAAKVGGIQANIDSPADFLYQNLQIQNNIIEAARLTGVKKLLFVGSSCIYPRESIIPITEDSLLKGPLEPTNEGYALAKVAGVKLCQFYRKQYGCNFISAIPTNIFGINDHYDLRTSHLLPALIMKIHKAKTEGLPSIELWGSGRPKREFMLSDDCADALVYLMENYDGEEPVNVGINEDKSIAELASAVSDVLEAKVDLMFDTTKPDGMLRKLISSEKLLGIGWKSKYSLKEGIKIAYDDYLSRNA